MKVRNKKEVIAEARSTGNTVHSASLTDLCHLENSELELQYQNYKGRVVLRSDIVEDDSGSYAVFAEQGSSAPQMIAAKVMDIIWTSSRRSIRLHPGQNGRCTHVILNFQSQNVSRYLDTSTEAQME